MPLTWPSALPALPIEAEGIYDPNFIVTEIDHGPRKKRRRYTAVSRKLSVRNWHLKGDDFETLVNFYEVGTRAGSDAFSMTNPLNGMGSVTARFENVIRWQIVIPSDHAGTRIVRVDCDLEVLA